MADGRGDMAGAAKTRRMKHRARAGKMLNPDFAIGQSAQIGFRDVFARICPAACDTKRKHKSNPVWKSRGRRKRGVRTMIPVHVAQVSYSDAMGFVVLLRSGEDRRTLPIVIGQPEAQAIALVMDKIQAPRPLTHDLLKAVLDNLECRMKRAEICDLKDNTFFAKLVLERGAAEICIDVRPSDAIALALRCAAPILAARRVMDAAGVLIPDAGGEKGGPRSAEKEISQLDRLKVRIQKAIEDERYEDAAKLRDEINRLTKHN